MLRRSPRVVLPQISGNSRPADFGGRLSILGGTSRAWAAGTDALPRRSLPALYCCPYRRQQSGGFRRAASYIGQIVRGQWVQTFCRVALSASFCRQYTATAIQRSRPTPCTTAKPCYCKSCVTAFGGWPRASRAWQRAQMLCRAALSPRCTAAHIGGSSLAAFGGQPAISDKSCAGNRHRRSAAPFSPASCGRLYPAAAGRRISEAGWLYWGDKPCAGSGYRRSAAPLSPALYCCRLYPPGGRQRFGGFLKSRPAPRTAAKPCFCKSCVTAFGRSTLRRVL